MSIISDDDFTLARKYAREQIPNGFSINKLENGEYECYWEDVRVDVENDGSDIYDAIIHHEGDGYDFVITLSFELTDNGVPKDAVLVVEVSHEMRYYEVLRDENPTIYEGVPEYWEKDDE